MLTLSTCLQSQAESIVSILSDEPKVQQLRQDKAYNLQLLQEQYQIGPSQIDALYNFAKFQFECGNYSGAAEFLYHYRCELSSMCNFRMLTALPIVPACLFCPHVAAQCVACVQAWKPRSAVTAWSSCISWIGVE